MSKFKKKSATSQDIPTAALPDIIFMLLFFFMVTTVLRQDEPEVEQRFPDATQLSKIEKKSLVSYIYVGKPRNIDLYGKEARIQVNDVLIDKEEVAQFVNEERDKLEEAEKMQLTLNLKVDNNVKMGIVSDLQFELRKANARKILYTALPRGME